MKTGAADPAGFDGGVMRNEPKYLRANALYTARFVEAYKGEGITINAVCPQNEPGYEQNYPTCGWGKYRGIDGTDHNGAEYLSSYVADYLAPTLKQRAPETDIWFGTLSNDTYASAYWSAAVAKAGSLIKAGGLQWNNVGLVSTIANGGYLVIQTEHQCGNYPWLTTYATSPADATPDNFLRNMAPNNHAYAIESWNLMTKWIKAGVHVYSAWNMVLDTAGMNLDQSRKWPQNALLAINKKTKMLHVTPYYYVMRHIAQYVDTGAVRLGTTGGDALAFKNPNGSIVTIVYNSGNNQANMTIAVGGKNRQISVPGQGWATLCVNWEKPVKAISERGCNQSVLDGRDLTVTCKNNGYCVTLPEGKAGRIELLTLTGQVLASKVVPQGSREIMLGKQAVYSGALIVRFVNGSGVKTAQIVTAQ